MNLRALKTAALAACLTPSLSAQFIWNEVPMSGASHPLYAVIDDMVRLRMAAYTPQVTAVSVAIKDTVDDRVVYERGFGWRDYHGGDLTPLAPNNVMRIASISKPITAAAIHDLAAKGLISLSDKVFQYGQSPVVGLLPANPYAPYDGALGDADLLDITVMDLLLHRGGFDRNQAPGDPQFLAATIASTLGVPSPPGPVNTVKYMLSQPLPFTPGDPTVTCGPNPDVNYCYSNFGYMLLGLIIEQVTGDYHDYIHSEFLASWGGAPREMQLGHGLKEDQYWTEPAYETTETATSVYPPYTADVSSAYGGWEQEVFLGHGDLVANTVQLLNFASRYHMSTNYISPATLPIIGQPILTPSLLSFTGHDGSLPGTSSIVISESDFCIAIIINQRDAAGGSDFLDDLWTDIRDMIKLLPVPPINATDTWVDFDLFFPLTGHFDSPVNSLSSALSKVQEGGRIKFKPGSTDVASTINEFVVLEAPLGPARLGLE